MPLGNGTHCYECARYELGLRLTKPHTEFGVKVATLEIDSWQTYCSACHKSTGWTPTHETVYGYGPENGSAGCGAKFDSVTFSYIYVEDPRVNDDRYPQWMKDLPLV